MPNTFCLLQNQLTRFPCFLFFFLLQTTTHGSSFFSFFFSFTKPATHSKYDPFLPFFFFTDNHAGSFFSLFFFSFQACYTQPASMVPSFLLLLFFFFFFTDNHAGSFFSSFRKVAFLFSFFSFLLLLRQTTFVFLLFLIFLFFTNQLNSWPLFFAGVDRSSNVGGASCIWQQRVRGCIALLGLRQWWWSGSTGPAVATGLIAGSPAGARGSHIQLGRQI
jgi:hypothetical protein